MNPSWVGEVGCFRINKSKKNKLFSLGSLGRCGWSHHQQDLSINLQVFRWVEKPEATKTPPGTQVHPKASRPPTQTCQVLGAEWHQHGFCWGKWCFFFDDAPTGPLSCCALVKMWIGWLEKNRFKREWNTKKDTFRQKTLWIGLHQRRKIPCDLWGNGDVPEKTTTQKWESPDGNRWPSLKVMGFPARFKQVGIFTRSSYIHCWSI